MRCSKTVLLSLAILFLSFSITPSHPSSGVLPESSEENVGHLSLYDHGRESIVDEQSTHIRTRLLVNNVKSLGKNGITERGSSEINDMRKDGERDGDNDKNYAHLSADHRKNFAEVAEGPANRDKETRNEDMNVDRMQGTTVTDFISASVNKTLKDMRSDREKLAVVRNISRNHEPQKFERKYFHNEPINDELKTDDRKRETYWDEGQERRVERSIMNATELQDSYQTSNKWTDDSLTIYPCGEEETKCCLDVGAYTRQRVTPPQDCGLMATDNHPCQRESLIVTTSAYIDPSIIEHCKGLTNLILEGNDWDCSRPDDWLWLQNPKKFRNDNMCPNCCNLNATAAFCRENHKLQLINTIMDKHINSTCPGGCFCRKRNLGGVFTPVIYCDGKHFNDTSLPDQYPRYTHELNLQSNKLVSTEMVMEKLSSLRFLVYLYLDNNQLDAFPTNLPFRHLRYLYMVKNNITTLDSAVIADIVNEHPDILIEITDNPLKCGCFLYWIQEDEKLLREISFHFEGYRRLRCEEQNHSVRMWFYDTTHCKPTVTLLRPSVFPFVILGIFNAIFIYFTIDLIIVKVKMRKHSDIVTRPKMHLVIKAFIRIMKMLTPSSQENEPNNEQITHE